MNFTLFVMLFQNICSTDTFLFKDWKSNRRTGKAINKQILISKVQFIRTINRTDFRTVRFTNIFILYEKINNKSFRKGWSSSPALYYHYNLGMTKVQIQTYMSKIHLGNIINSNLFDCFNLDYRNGLSSSIVYEAHRDCTNSSHTIYYNY